jgi:RND family efflux transporter MFP subunit
MDGQSSSFTSTRLRPLPAGWRARLRDRRVLVGAAAVLVAAITLIIATRSGGPAAATPRQPERPVVTVSVPGTSDVERTVTFSGAIAARNDMPIGVEGEGGRIAAVLVEAGDRVEAGQVLARIDTSTLRPQLASLKAALERAVADENLARAEYARAEAVATAGALSREEIDRRRAAALKAEADVRVATAELNEMRARIARTEIRAPAAGVVLTRSAEVGQVASSASGELFRLARDGEMELRGAVPEQDLPKLALGQPATVRLTGVEQPFRGEVRLLGAVIDPETRLGEVRVALGASPDLRPGAFAQGEIALGRERLPVVAQTAVLSDAAGNYVFIAGNGDRVERRAVRVSGITPAGVVIAEGLTGSERVVSTAGAFLREGEQITPASPTPAADTAGLAP